MVGDGLVKLCSFLSLEYILIKPGVTYQISVLKTKERVGLLSDRR